MQNPGHRGYEVRFCAYDQEETKTIIELLAMIGIRAGKPFPQGRQFRVPVYGSEQVLQLLTLIAPEQLDASGLVS